MINELAGHLWWASIKPGCDDYHVFLQAGNEVYRCSQRENVWRQVEALPDQKYVEFSQPLKKRISRCLTASDGCKYVFFTDGTAIRVFNPPDEPGWITIHSHAGTFLDQERYAAVLAANETMVETPIVHG